MYSSLRVVTPPAAEPISLDEARLHLRVDQNVDDMLIQGLITAARMTIEGWTGRALVTQTLLWTMSQNLPSGGLPILPLPLLILPVILSAPQLMNKPMELPRSPVQSIVSVQQTDTDGTATVMPTGSWIADLALDPARVRLCWMSPARSLQHVQVQFVAGYGDAPATPEPIKMAMKLLVAHLYEQRGDNSAAAGAPPVAIDYLLAPYKVQFFG